MSSAEDVAENTSVSLVGYKKRRTRRACDLCRRRKIRCIVGNGAGDRCSNCIAYRSECTHHQPSVKKRSSPNGYVEGLERRLETLEKFLQQAQPDMDFTQALVGNADVDPGLLQQASGSTNGSSPITNASPIPPLTFPSISTDGNKDDEPSLYEDRVHDEDVVGGMTLNSCFEQLSLSQDRPRFFGTSSGFFLIQKAMDIKNEISGLESTRLSVLPGRSRRPEFWNMQPWEASDPEEPPHYTYPEPDLIAPLVGLYFRHVNTYLPLLHRPTLEKSIAENLHLIDHKFGAVLLLVLALGSRFSDDPRVLLETANSPRSCGFQWYKQVRSVRKTFVEPTTLYELQRIALAVIYLVGSSSPQESWSILGIGVRAAQEVGIHRRKPKGHRRTVRDELWNRAFWVLMSIDKFLSSFLGRPCAIHEEDFDLDYPVECDDEYWENSDPDLAFKQPPNKPSTVAYFNSFLKLFEILGMVLRTIYSVNKSKVLHGFVGKQWEQQIVAQLDSELNKWADSIPDHLRWDPHRENPLFFDQSAFLYASYYHIQILIHRPFIPSPRNPSPLKFPSLAICANAARSCCHVLSIQNDRGILSLPNLQIAVFTSGIILLLNIWSGKKSGISINANKEMEDVHKCMKVLQSCEAKFHSTGRFRDILCELATMGELPLPSSTVRSKKRERDMDNSGTELVSDPSPKSTIPTGVVSPTFSQLSSAYTYSDSVEHQYNSKGSREVSPRDVPILSNARVREQQLRERNQGMVPLPIHSDELGRLPLHGQFNFSSAATLDFGYGSFPSDSPQSMEGASPDYSASTPSSLDCDPSIFMDQQLYDQMTSIFYDSFGESIRMEPDFYPGSESTTMGLSSEQGVLNGNVAMWTNLQGYESPVWGAAVKEQ